MDKKEIIAFFDNLAPNWHENQNRNEAVIEYILDSSEIKKGAKVLDVACGTGILFEDYRKRGVASLTGIDISAEMVKVAKEKFPWAEIICGDAESYSFDKKFDAVMVYNAFPHFINPEALFKNLAQAINEGGRLTVAHGASAKEIEDCHKGSASGVSMPLPDVKQLSEMMSPYFETDVSISDERMYIVSGKVKKGNS